MPEFDTDTLLPPKHGVMTPFAKFAWTLIGLLVLALIWAGVKKNKPDLFRSPDALIESARQAINAKNWDQAAQDLARARTLSPDNVKVTQAIIELLKLTGTNSAELLQMIQNLNKREAPSPELQLLMAQTLFRLGRVAEAHQACDQLPATIKSGTKALELMAGVLNAEGQPREAAEFMHRSILAMPDSQAKEFKLAMEGIRHPFSSVSQKARQTLWLIAQSKSDLALQAVAQLASLSDLKAAEYNDLLKILGKFTDKNLLAIRLEVISALARLQPDQRDALFAEEVRRFRQRAAPGVIPTPSATSQEDSKALLDNDLRILSRWLAQEKQHELLLELSPLKEIWASTELFSCLARALAEDQHWSELQTLLTERKPPVDPIRVQIWLATAAGHLHPETDEARKLLTRAIDAAGKNKNAMLLIAAALAAEQLNEQDLALAAYQQVASFDEKRAVGILEEVYGKAEIIKDTDAMLRTAAKLHRLCPENQALADRLTYLQLICGRDFEVAGSAVLKLESQKVDDKSLAELLQALAAYRFADARKLDQHLGRVTQVSSFTAGQRAVYAGLLAKTGHEHIAFEVAEKVPNGLLLPEELILLKLAL